MGGTSKTQNDVISLIQDEAHPLISSVSDWDPILTQIGDRSIVLMGEATHGTHEFYKARAELTQRLIEEKGFSALAIEADWPDALALNSFILRDHDESHIMETFSAFQRFPMWMWRNSEFLRLVEWLNLHNSKEKTAHQVSLFGIDLYSLYRSMGEVIRYLERIDYASARHARELYSCFDHAGGDPVRYGRLVRIEAQESCESAAIEAAKLLFSSKITKGDLRVHAGTLHEDELFYAQRHAELVRNAESYYRNLFSPVVNTWNVRDRHMASTVDHILKHLESRGRNPKIIVWAHNSHVGDDRATEMGKRGQWNIGQLLREMHPEKTFNLGFTTFEGTVMAAREWDEPPELRNVNPALPESFEGLFHRTGLNDFYLDLTRDSVREPLNESRLERAIGVIYAPETERFSHYFHARLAEQFDGVIHFDRTSAVDPLDRVPVPELADPSPVQF